MIRLPVSANGHASRERRGNASIARADRETVTHPEINRLKLAWKLLT